MDEVIRVWLINVVTLVAPQVQVPVPVPMVHVLDYVVLNVHRGVLNLAVLQLSLNHYFSLPLMQADGVDGNDVIGQSREVALCTFVAYLERLNVRSLELAVDQCRALYSLNDVWEFVMSSSVWLRVKVMQL